MNENIVHKLGATSDSKGFARGLNGPEKKKSETYTASSLSQMDEDVIYISTNVKTKAKNIEVIDISSDEEDFDGTYKAGNKIKLNNCVIYLSSEEEEDGSGDIKVCYISKIPKNETEQSDCLPVLRLEYSVGKSLEVKNELLNRSVPNNIGNEKNKRKQDSLLTSAQNPAGGALGENDVEGLDAVSLSCCDSNVTQNKKLKGDKAQEVEKSTSVPATTLAQTFPAGLIADSPKTKPVSENDVVSTISVVPEPAQISSESPIPIKFNADSPKTNPVPNKEVVSTKSVPEPAQIYSESQIPMICTADSPKTKPVPKKDVVSTTSVPEPAQISAESSVPTAITCNGTKSHNQLIQPHLTASRVPLINNKPATPQSKQDGKNLQLMDVQAEGIAKDNQPHLKTCINPEKSTNHAASVATATPGKISANKDKNNKNNSNNSCRKDSDKSKNHHMNKKMEVQCQDKESKNLSKSQTTSPNQSAKESGPSDRHSFDLCDKMGKPQSVEIRLNNLASVIKKVNLPNEKPVQQKSTVLRSETNRGLVNQKIVPSSSSSHDKKRTCPSEAVGAPNVKRPTPVPNPVMPPAAKSRQISPDSSTNQHKTKELKKNGATKAVVSSSSTNSQMKVAAPPTETKNKVKAVPVPPVKKPDILIVKCVAPSTSQQKKMVAPVASTLMNQAQQNQAALCNMATPNWSFGMNLLRRTGSNPGKLIGKDQGSILVPIKCDIKPDKGLGSVTDTGVSIVHVPMVLVNIKNIFRKHPTSVLHELCDKLKWGRPEFKLVDIPYPTRQGDLLVKVRVQGVDYQSCVCSWDWKLAKAMASQVCLETLGLMPRNVNT